MTTYKKSGVNVAQGDRASELAYAAAKRTFSSRKNSFGKPVILEGGFTGLIDMGDFYLVQNDDGIGSKTLVAEALKKYDTLGYDLVAMVADDAICVGAEVISISNTIDTPRVDPDQIADMMKGLEKACIEQKIIIPGGEIGELPHQTSAMIWNATAVGVLEKKKFINAKNVYPGDTIIGITNKGFRSNGLTLVRHVLEKAFGKKWPTKPYATKSHGKKITWGEAVLTPAQIYHAALLNILGRYKQPRRANIKGIAHMTGGGIAANISRILKPSDVGAQLDLLPDPDPMMTKLQALGNITDRAAYETWNMGLGMALITDEPTKLLKLLRAQSSAKGQRLTAHIIGHVIPGDRIHITSRGHFNKEKIITFPVD